MNEIQIWLDRNRWGFAVTSYTTAKAVITNAAIKTIEGIAPYDVTIANRTYPLVTGYSIYLKDRHVRRISGLQ